MVIDQDLCTGCQACVTACAMENNISFVGEEDAGYGRSMQWIRIERFWDGEYPRCDHATSSRCCASSAARRPASRSARYLPQCTASRSRSTCRSTTAASARATAPTTARTRCASSTGAITPRPEPLNNQLNPDVTVRRRGVMEKCTFCIQRIRRGEDKAKAEGREVLDGEVVPACAQACPADAIIFGRLDDPESQVSQLARSERGYKLLEELGTLPRVTYLKGGSSHGGNG